MEKVPEPGAPSCSLKRSELHLLPCPLRCILEALATRVWLRIRNTLTFYYIKVKTSLSETEHKRQIFSLHSKKYTNLSFPLGIFLVMLSNPLKSAIMHKTIKTWPLFLYNSCRLNFNFNSIGTILQ